MAVCCFPSALQSCYLSSVSCRDTPVFCSFTHACCDYFCIAAAHAAMQIRSNQIHNTPNMSVQKVFACPLPRPAHCLQLANRRQLGGLIFFLSVCLYVLLVCRHFCSGCVLLGENCAFKTKIKSLLICALMESRVKPPS